MRCLGIPGNLKLGQNLLDEKAKDEEIKNELKVTIEDLKQKPEIKLPKHLSSVHTAHLPLLKGFKMLYKTLGNGRCLENSVAVHIFENEDEGINVKKMINNHIADNFENYYHNIINLPYKEVIMEEGHTKVIEKKTKEEFVEFLRSEESLAAFSNCQELVAVANVFNIKIHIFEYRGKDGRWSEIHPDPDMTSTATMVGSWAPELFLYNNSNTHYDLLVRDDSRLVDGLVGKVIENEANEGWKNVKNKKHKKGVTFVSGEKLLSEETHGNESDIELDEALTLSKGKEHGYRRASPQVGPEDIFLAKPTFKCSQCDKTLESQGLLDAHMQIHKNNIHECETCGLKFQMENALRMHVKSSHKVEIEYEWNCNDCSFQASEPSELMKHLKLNPLKPGVWERLVIPRGGAQRPPLQSQ